MSITIRKADFHLDKALIIDAVARNISPQSNSKRFDWLYLDNPYGKAHAWIAMDSNDDSIVGMASAFPRLMKFEEGNCLGWVLGDFCINPQYRSLGPAIQLQQTFFNEIKARNVHFFYDYPSATMLAIYKRLGIKNEFQSIRLVKFLLVNQRLLQNVESLFLRTILRAVGNRFIRFPEIFSWKGHNVEIALHEGECHEEFSELFDSQSHNYGGCVVRSAEYLNWRFLANPTCPHKIFVARSERKLIGYLVLALNGLEAVIADIFVEKGSIAVFRALLYFVVQYLRRLNVSSLNFHILNGDPMIRLFKWNGFWQREFCPVVAHGMVSIDNHRKEFGAERLFLTNGDRDS